MELTTTKRTITGKKVRQLRSQGIIPAVVYGQEIGSIPLTVTEADFRELYHQVSEGGLLTIKVDDQRYSVLLRDLQIDPVSRQLLHIDFFQVDLTKKVEVTVPLVAVGESLAVESGLGILLMVRDEVEVECLPTDIPDQIEVDISVLKEVGDALVANQLSIDQDKITLLVDQDETLVKISPAVMEEEVEQLGPRDEVGEEEAGKEGKAETGKDEDEEEEGGEEAGEVESND